MKVRKSLAAAVLASTTVLVAAGCSEEAQQTASDAVSSAVGSAVDRASAALDEATSAAKSAARDALLGLDSQDAQNILRTAVNPDTTSDELDNVVDVSNPATKPAMEAYVQASSAAGLTPESYTVTNVSADGDNQANASVSIQAPNAAQPTDTTPAYVKVDGNWKLSGDAVTQLSSMTSQYGN